MKILDKLINLISYDNSEEYNFTLSKDPFSGSNANSKESPDISNAKNVFPSIDVNKEYIKNRFDYPNNSDIKIREFTITVREKQYSAFLLYIEGMIDSASINRFVIEPLMLNKESKPSKENPDVISKAVTHNVTVRRVKKFDLSNYLLDCLVPQNDVSTDKVFDNIAKKVNAGVSALFIDTLDNAFLIDAKGFEKRGISTPENENVIRGPQEAFTETLRTNTSLLRRIVNNEQLIIEEMNIGKVSNTQVALCYMENIANASLVNEARHRLKNISIDYLVSSRSTRRINSRFFF